jgi:hypothetical protein
MDAASSQQHAGRGAPRLLRHCAALDRVTARDEASARSRLESELGSELVEFLLGALAGDRGRRPALALV